MKNNNKENNIDLSNKYNLYNNKQWGYSSYKVISIILAYYNYNPIINI